MVYVIPVCWQLAISRGRTEPSWKTTDDGQRNCPKHVEFYSKNKFEKLVHLVGFIKRIPLDEWSARHRDFWHYITRTTDRQTFFRLDSKPQSQQASGCSPTSRTTRPPVSVRCIISKKNPSLNNDINSTCEIILSRRSYHPHTFCSHMKI